MIRIVMPLAAVLLCAGAVSAQDRPRDERREEQKDDKKDRGWRGDATTVVSQPGRDVGVVKTKIPPILQQAAEDPYTLKGLTTCRQYIGEVAQLTEVLGEDFATDAERKPKRDLAKAGGEAVAGLLIPFRGLVREVTGAAGAERRLNAAIDAGFARRGFLRGTMKAKRCKG